MTFDKIETFVTFNRKTRRRFKPTDPDFVAPDGGWGWMVVFACGLSNLSIYSMLQQFGLVFTEKFQDVGISHTQTTTIININLALTSCIGLFNGPIYRKFSFRKVGMFGSSLVVCSLLMISCCNSFWSFFICYGLLFGTSLGLTLSANSLALNTYFKEKRSIATGFSWGITGLGPIAWPYIITILMNYYGTEGTVLLFAGFAGHAFLCALLLQPVHWHTKYRDETEIPLMPISTIGQAIFVPESDELTINLPSINGKTDDNKTSPKFNNNINECNNNELHFIQKNNSENVIKNSSNLPKSKIVDTTPDTSFFKQIIKFFDLDIMKDLVYLNIIFGMITINFVEWNSTILTPAILKEFHFEKYQIATYMSLLGITDVSIRFTIPFIARKLKWNNRVLYLLGAVLTTTGRMALLHTQDFFVSLFIAIVVGIGRGLSVVYLALLIPGHVSLQKLPAALGIYLAAFGLFLIMMAPVIGWIRDTSHSFVTTVHVLNILIYIAAFSWIIEYLTKKRNLRTKVNEVSK